MSKPVPEHTDIIGQPLTEGCHVAIARGNSMYVCAVRKLSPKKIRVFPTKTGWGSSDGFLVYPHDTVVLSGPDVLAYILKHR